MIGGDGLIVKIDESKFGKSKPYRGHHVGVWVLGGVERTIERKVFLVPVEDGSSETLKWIINSHVISGSIIYILICEHVILVLTPKTIISSDKHCTVIA